MRRKSRIIAAVMCCMIVITILSPAVIAATPGVTVDEAMYVNLDYYGAVSDVSIVKSANLNGNTSYTDYGKYQKISNMTDFTQPLVKEDSITWELPNADEQFYFECKPKDNSNILPWDFDISYRLNGAPIKAESLAGASGLVEVEIHAIPNENAKEYYRNNMILIAATLVDTKDVISFSAPGAQMQALGSNKAALFLAMPGEDTTFTYSIGTDSFETIGTIMVMVPATLSQLDEIKDLKEDKQDIEDAAQALSDSLDDILDSLNALPSGLRTTQSGLDNLNSARESIYNNKDQIYASGDLLQASLNRLRSKLIKAGDDLEDSSGTISDLGDDFVSSATDLAELQKTISNIYKTLTRLQKDIEALQQASTPEEQRELLNSINAEAGRLNAMVDAVSEYISMDDLKQAIDEFSAAMQNFGGATPSEMTPEQQAQFQQLMAEMMTQLGGITDSMSQSVTAGDAILGQLEGATGSLSGLGDDAEAIMDSTSSALRRTSAVIGNTKNFLSSIQKTFKECDEALNLGTQQTLEGLMDVLGQTANGLEKTDDLIKNKQVITDIVKDQWNKLDDEYGFFDIDTSAQKISFTSEKNPAPESLQIILRTQEIELDDQDETTQANAPADAENDGFWHRLGMIFVKIWNAICSIFS
ncbi:hypothetical protein [Youxingia wuxianensis]|uniref:Uncharacterized protein n=1 Tax=Youxingia wuxianensis TaxID=2763678 RepID=A0A926EQ83_9FIRM|nr:hypothetical protein [Youxingia wuxianensis]MBC8584539.1 hypothetical protein [Youxingia wuxianensis]